ncbi:MAG: GIY-YIG nuclease family protein [Candidatus Omnitrophica bacterium]|nr:GIY-YIG nuclease family protein [Candidatus Omnitrophota bacterium]
MECENGALYTGMTNDLSKRLLRHKKGTGARYTKTFGVKNIVYWEKFSLRVEAMRREAEIKKWSRKNKEELIRNSTKALSLAQAIKQQMLGTKANLSRKSFKEICLVV